MGSQTFKVSVDKVFFDFMRGKTGQHDNDWATLTVSTLKGGGSRSWSGYQLASEIISGAFVEDLQPPLELTDFVLDDDDGLFVSLQIMNQSFEPTLAKALAWSGVVIAALSGIEMFLGDANKVAIAVKEGRIEAAISGALLAMAKLVDQFGPQQCDGFVFNRVYPPRTVAQLIQDTHGEVGSAFAFPADPYTEKNSKGCGHDPVTRVNLSITLTANNPDLGKLPPGSAGPPGEPVTIKSLAAAPGTAWGGRWEDAHSNIFCIIGVTEPTVPGTGTGDDTAIVNAAVSALTLPQVLPRLGTDPRQPPRQIASPSQAASPDTPLTGQFSEPTVLATMFRFSVNVTEVITTFLFETLNITAQTDLAVAVPMVVTPRTGDHFASELTKIQIGDPAPGTGATAEAGGLAGGDDGTKQIVPVLAPLELGATICVTDNVFLQLYAGFDSNGRFVDHQVRYLRTDDTRKIVTDVMLIRPQVLT